ncbi:hypothetical protein ABZS88_26420 [Streptomyces sp. NPDC005480]|uniref:hypothetical protein n=1 Tax=Streptomyces sp. NPDC005480 TaxID=3154880 RepID=UPI0033B7BD1B
MTAPFWSNASPYNTFRLDMNKRLDLGRTVPRRRTPSDASARSNTETRCETSPASSPIPG